MVANRKWVRRVWSHRVDPIVIENSACKGAATPPGSDSICDVTGDVASLNPRLIAATAVEVDSPLAPRKLPFAIDAAVSVVVFFEHGRALVGIERQPPHAGTSFQLLHPGAIRRAENLPQLGRLASVSHDQCRRTGTIIKVLDSKTCDRTGCQSQDQRNPDSRRQVRNRGAR